MNGATADDWAKNINAPKSTNMMTMGASHHFLFSIMNDQNSVKTRIFPTIPSLIQSFVILFCKGFLLTREPIGLLPFFNAPVQRIEPEQPHRKPRRRHDAVEYDA